MVEDTYENQDGWPSFSPQPEGGAADPFYGTTFRFHQTWLGWKIPKLNGGFD